MLYKVGRTKDIDQIKGKCPPAVYSEILRGAAMRDSWYGEDRDFLEEGGYSVLLDEKADLEEFETIVNYKAHPCEWATRVGKSGYISVLYMLNEDFSIDLYLPIDITPNTIMNDLEE